MTDVDLRDVGVYEEGQELQGDAGPHLHVSLALVAVHAQDLRPVNHLFQIGRVVTVDSLKKKRKAGVIRFPTSPFQILELYNPLLIDGF